MYFASSASIMGHTDITTLPASSLGALARLMLLCYFRLRLSAIEAARNGDSTARMSCMDTTTATILSRKTWTEKPSSFGVPARYLGIPGLHP
jgi:hypothetical protein